MLEFGERGGVGDVNIVIVAGVAGVVDEGLRVADDGNDGAFSLGGKGAIVLNSGAIVEPECGWGGSCGDGFAGWGKSEGFVEVDLGGWAVAIPFDGCFQRSGAGDGGGGIRRAEVVGGLDAKQ